MLRRLLAHRTTQNAFWLTLAQVTNYVAQLSIIPFLTRSLTVEEFGATMAAVAATQLAFVITDYGFSLSGTYEVSANRADSQRVQTIISEVHSAKILLISVAILGVVLVSYIPAYRPHQIIFLCAVFAIAGKAMQPIWFFQGLEDMKSYAAYVSLAKIIFVTVTFLAVRGQGDGYRVLLALGVAEVAAAVVGLWMMRKLGYRTLGLRMRHALAGLRASFNYFVSRIAVALYTSASALIVGTASLGQAALYASAEQAYKAGQSVTAPINQALYPYMAANRRATLLFKIVPIVLSVLALGAALISYLAEPIALFVFGPDYGGVAPVLRIFMITVLVNYVGVSFGYPMFAALNAPRIANNTVMIGAGVHLIILSFLYFTNELSALSVSIVVLLTEAVVMSLRVCISVHIVIKI